jgi:CO/xanthine dehydrogenase Mo-binding subunit
MGQGVNAKIQEVAARIFSIRPERIKLEPTSTSRIANMLPTAASTGADLNGHAARLACIDILGSFKETAARCLGKESLSPRCAHPVFFSHDPGKGPPGLVSRGPAGLKPICGAATLRMKSQR